MFIIETLKQHKDLWDLYTKEEEYHPPFLDKFKRFTYYLSRHRDVLEPRISEFLRRKGLRVEYPDGRKFAVCLTHDVDAVHFSRPELGFHVAEALVKRQIRGALIIGSDFVRRSGMLWNFRDIMALEEKYGAKSSFYFEALEKNDLDFNYDIQELENELRAINDRGWEIGLHGGHDAYSNLDHLKKQKQTLEKTLGEKVIGYRSHFLHFKTPITWNLLSAAGFEYDTTFGYTDMVGFRNGMCHPFRPFDLNTNKEISILEIPLTITDNALSESHMRLDVQSAWKITKLLIDTVEKNNGVITLLWHNNCIFDENLASLLALDKCSNKQFYEKILKYCHEKKAWMTSGEEIWRTWSPNRLF